MTAPLTDTELDEIEARAKAASKAPWLDYEFFVEACTDIPAIIAEMRRLQIALTTARAEMRERAAKIAAAHDYDAGVKKLGPANYKYASDEARAEFAAGVRGERVAKEMIERAIRDLPLFEGEKT